MDDDDSVLLSSASDHENPQQEQTHYEPCVSRRGGIVSVLFLSLFLLAAGIASLFVWQGTALNLNVGASDSQIQSAHDIAPTVSMGLDSTLAGKSSGADKAYNQNTLEKSTSGKYSTISINKGMAMATVSSKGAVTSTATADAPNPMLEKMNPMFKEKLLPGLNKEFPNGIKKAGMDPMTFPPPTDASSPMAFKTLAGLSDVTFTEFVATGLTPPGSDGLAAIAITLSGHWNSNLIMSGTMTMPPKRRLGLLGKLIKPLMKPPSGPMPLTCTMSKAALTSTSIKAFLNISTKTITSFTMPDLAVTIGSISAHVTAGMMSSMIDGKINPKMGEMKTKMEAMLSKNFGSAILKAFQSMCPMPAR